MGSHAHRRVANWQQRCVRAAAASLGCGSTAWHDLGLLCVCSLRVLHGAGKSCTRVASLHRPEACRAPALPTPRPRHCHARTRCPAPCTRAHACRARSSRTHHACAPRQPCTCSHAATRAHVKKLGCRARVTGHWLTVGRLAAGTSGANALCNALATFAARETHASSTRCACHPPPTLLSSYAET